MHSSDEVDTRKIVVSQIREGVKILSEGIADGYMLIRNALWAGDRLCGDGDILLVFAAVAGFEDFVRTRAEEFDDGEKFLMDLSRSLERLAGALEERNHLLDSLTEFVRVLHKARNSAYRMKRKRK